MFPIKCDIFGDKKYSIEFGRVKKCFSEEDFNNYDHINLVKNTNNITNSYDLTKNNSTPSSSRFSSPVPVRTF